MNMNEYHGLIEKYGASPGEWAHMRASFAFEEFACQMEEYEYNERSKDERNEGRELMHISVEQVGKIIDDYLDRVSDDDWLRERIADHMRNTIQDVTGLIC